MIYSKTSTAQDALRSHASGLSQRQRSALIMFDGKKSAADVLRLTASLGVLASDVDHLVEIGFLHAGVGSAAVPAQAAAPTLRSSVQPIAAFVTSEGLSVVDGADAEASLGLTPQARYSLAYPIATRLTAALGLRGFRLNLAVEAAGDWDKLHDLAPKIREAVGPEKFKELERALSA